MCGRVTQRISSAELARLFAADDLVDSDVERFNVAPTDPLVVVVERDGRRTVERRRWGLIPSWAADARGGARMINARAETLLSSRAFRPSFERLRCVVPVAGFYEWRRRPDGRRQPYYVTRLDGRPLPFAGLRATWSGGEAGVPLRTCSIVTTRPNELLAPIHDRMPAILPDAAVGSWLDPAFGRLDELLAALEPYPGDDLVAYPVSSLVNSVRNDAAALIVPAEPPEEPSLALE